MGDIIWFVFVVSKFCLWDVVMRYYMYSNGTLLIIDATALCIWQGSLMHNSQNLFWVYMHTLEAYLMNLCLKAVSMLLVLCTWLQASLQTYLDSERSGKYLRVPLYSTVFSDDRKRRLLTVDILSGWLLPPEKLDVYHKKTESWKDIDWQSSLLLLG